MQRQNLLIEIGSEELPPTRLFELGEAFAASLQKACNEAGFDSGKAHSFVTPRRIAARLEAVAGVQADQTITRKGPLVNKAYDKDGNPLPAAIGFAKACGVEVSELKILKDENRLYVQKTVTGKPINDCVAQLLEQALEQLPIAKRMRWGNEDYEFIRPIRWLLALYGEVALSIKVMGITSATHTYGHRYHKPEPLTVTHADNYEDILERSGMVIPSFAIRLQKVKSQVLVATQSGTAQINDELLAQVTSIVEWPVAMSASFDKSFLKLPLTVITEILEKEQRCFTVLAADGSLAAEFIVVANIESTNPQSLRHGYERVVKPRLKDAEFFINQDRKYPLSYYARSLDTLTFHHQLGSLADKVERIAKLAVAIAGYLASTPDVYHFDPANIELIEKAAALCKADLKTSIVCEYPELAGFIGGYYAECDGEESAVCQAIQQHLRPRRAGDTLPQENIAIVLAIADRLDTLVGIFGCGEYPSGSRDPYALRRASLALIRIVTEHQLNLDLATWLSNSRQNYSAELVADGMTKLSAYLKERLKHYFIDCGFSGDKVEAVSVVRPLHGHDIHQRLCALRQVMQLPQSSALAAATKRIHNILKSYSADDLKEINPTALHDDAEYKLYEAYSARSMQVQALIEKRDYLEALKVLAQLRQPIDNFFDQVLVMSEDADERNNRLALLHRIQCLFMQIVDFSALQAE